MSTGSPRSIKVVTIGHSNHDWPHFLHLLEIANMGVVADVRSYPSSRLPHFNASTLKARLAAAGISYVYLGRELGGLTTDGSLPDYDRMAAAPAFLDGIVRVEEIAARTLLALMCSEHEPLNCHRCLLVGRHLALRGAAIAHILRDGTIEPNAATEDRLLKLTRQSEGDLLASRADRLAAAYRAQALRITRKTR
jgi:uncharacterized protein (DUF488 family)